MVTTIGSNRGPAPKCNPAGCAFRSTTQRDGYIKSTRTCVDAVYNVPGAFAEAMKTTARVPSAAFRSSTPRDGYTKQSRHINVNVVNNVPGMAEVVSRSRKGAWAKPPVNSARDSYIREVGNRFVDAVYDVPGVGDAWKSNRNRGTAAFRSSSTRDGHLNTNKGRFIDVYYEVPGIGSPSKWTPCPASAAFKGSTTPRDSYISDAKCHMNAVDLHLKGMAEEIMLSPKGKFPKEGQHDGRDGYIRSSRKTADLVYDVPGMADVINSARSRSPTAAFRPGPSDRDSYIKAQHKMVDAMYDLPCMADLSPMTMSFGSQSQVSAGRDQRG